MVFVRALAYTVMSMMELFFCICIEFTRSFGRNCILALADGRSLRMNNVKQPFWDSCLWSAHADSFFALNRHFLCYFSIRVSVKASFELKYTQQTIIGMVKYTKTAKEWNLPSILEWKAKRQCLLRTNKQSACVDQSRVRNLHQLITNATENRTLATKIIKLVTSCPLIMKSFDFTSKRFHALF